MHTINIALCCDNEFAQHLGVALCSALEHLSREGRARIFIVCSKFGRKNKKKILSIAATYNAEVQFIEVNIKDFKGLKVSHHISPAAYFRIALPDILPQELSKVLYMDCDLVVKDDLSKLYAVDIAEAPLAAVAEADQGSPVIPRQILGIPRDAVYFNSGVALINLQKWRQDGLSKKLFDFIRRNPDRLLYWDQDALNIFFHDSFMPLHYRWNFTMFHIEKPELYNIKDIGIIHFISYRKPWYDDCDHPFKGEYYKYLSMTPWSKFKPMRPKKQAFPPIPSPTKRIFAETANCGRLIFLIISGVKAITSRPLQNKKGLALSFVKYIFKNNLITLGLLRTPKYEQLLTYRINIADYKTFFIFFCEFFIQSDCSFSVLTSSPLIIDCGGNMGMAVFYFKNLYPDSKIIVFETDPKAFALIQENIKYNNLKGITVYNNAAYDPEGENIKGMLLSSHINEAADLLRLDRNGSELSIMEDLTNSGKIAFIKRVAIVFKNEGSGQESLKPVQEILEKNNFLYHVADDIKKFGKSKTHLSTLFAWNKKQKTFTDISFGD